MSSLANKDTEQNDKLKKIANESKAFFDQMHSPETQKQIRNKEVNIKKQLAKLQSMVNQTKGQPII